MKNTCAVFANVVSMWMVLASLVYFYGAVGSVVGRVEWQWRQAGPEAWWMVLATHPSCACVVSGASEEEQFVEWVVGCAESKRAEAAGSKVAGPCGFEEDVVEVPFFEVMNRGPAGAFARDDCRAGSESG